MRENWKPSPHESEPRVDMNSQEVMQLMQRMEYVGSGDLSKTQLRKARKEAAQNFFESAMSYPQWQDRIDEIWTYHGRGGDWKLKDWEYEDEYGEGK